MQTIYSKIAGVTYQNKDGESRQDLIRRYARNGSQLFLIPEPENPFSETAVGVWMDTKKGRKQLGYIRDTGLDDQLVEHIASGGKLTCTIKEVTGLYAETIGANIEIKLYEDDDALIPTAVKVVKSSNLKIIAITAVIMLLLCAFINAVSPANKTNAEPTVDVGAIQTRAFETALAQFPSETPVPTSTSTPEPTQTPVATVDVYVQEMIQRFANYQTAFNNMNEQQQKLQDDIGLMFDDDWRLQMGLYLGMLDVAATDLESIPNPPAEYAKLDQILKSIASETHLMVQNYAYGLDNMDADAINRAAVNMQNMTTYFSAGTDEINRLNSD